MKSCAKTRKRIALKAVDGADLRQDHELRAHLESCPGCRGYVAEISGVVESLGALELDSDIRASDAFHRKAIAAVEAFDRNPASKSLALRIQLLLTPPLMRCIAVPAMVIAVGLIVNLFVVNGPPAHFVASPPLVARAQPVPEVQSDPDPSVANYEMAANQSLEKLDDMITRQARKNPAPAPVYTAAALSRWIAPD